MPGARLGPWSSVRTARPMMASMASAGTPPGRRMAGGSTVRSTMVDSTPTLVGPPSSTRSTSSPRSSRTCSSGRGTHPTEPVGRGSGDATSEGRQQLEGQQMGRHPQPDGVAPAGHGRVDARSAVEQEGQRSRPAGVPERCGRGGDIRRPLRQRGGRRDVDDQRVVDRPALHGIEPAHRVRVGGVGAQAVHGLGREGHQPTGSQDRHRFAHLRRRHGASGRYGVEEPQHGVEERERLRGGEVVGVAERDEARIG